MSVAQQEVVIRTGPTLQDGSGGFVLTLDASVSQTHGATASVTSHPVEDGADVSDHVRLEPVVLTIQGIVSATPLGEGTTGPYDGREIDGWATLVSLVEQRKPITIITTLRSYADMVLTSVTTTREKGARAIYPQIEARQVRIVKTLTTALPPEKVKKPAQKATAPKTKELGAQATAAPTEAQQAKTLGAAAVDLLGTLLGGT